MASAEIDICNLALARIGQQVLITDLGVLDTSAPAQACKFLYPQARDALLQRFPFGFATKYVSLSQITVTESSSALDQVPGVPGWIYAYGPLPSDYLQAQYVFSGVRPGQPVAPLLSVGDVLMPAVVGLPLIAGRAPQIPFEIDSGTLFTDWEDPPGPDWDGATTYAVGDLVTYLGAQYVSLVVNSSGVKPVGDGTSVDHWGVTTQRARLVYTARVTDVTKFPSLFVDALAWKLAVDLALSQAAKPQLATSIRQQAEEAFASAAAAQRDGRQPDPRPASSFVAVRG